jgi:hypothetical protein
MERIAFDLISLSEGQLTAVFVGLILLGALVTSRLVTITAKLRRAIYFLLIAALTLALAAAQFGYRLAPAAAEAGVFEGLILAMMLASLLFGAGVYLLAAARSNDIQGNSKAAWRAFVPVLNLWLLFKKTGAAPDPALPNRSKLSRFLLDPLMICAALFSLALSRAVTDQLETSVQFSEADLKSLGDLYLRTRNAEELFDDMLAELKPTLPAKVDEVTTLRAAEATGQTLHLTFRIAEEATDGLYGQKELVTQQVCGEDFLGPAFRKGGHVIYRYEQPSGAVIVEFELAQKDCQV